MPVLNLHVDNLKCSGCASSIRRRLGELPYVVSVTVDPEAGTVGVTHDGTGTRLEVADVLSGLGYPEQGTGGLMEQAKSYLSCAIGRIHGEE
ncbi:MAG: heavy metal-associated domain-containing protein [Flavobacteriales bacterium]